MTITKWTKENIALIQSMEKTYTKQQIADKIGVTRGVVIGKLYRLQNTPKKYAPKTTKKKARRIPKRIELKDIVFHEKQVKSLMDLKNSDCRYPQDDGGFCCKEVVQFKSYCLSHMAKCYRNQKDKPAKVINSMGF